MTEVKEEPPVDKKPRIDEPPFSYRIAKGDDTIRKFLNDLMATHKTRQAVIHHCIESAMMGLESGISSKEVAQLRAEVATLQAQLKEATRNPKPETRNGFIPDGVVLEQLETVKKKKNMDTPEAIKYCINYTNRNLW